MSDSHLETAPFRILRARPIDEGSRARGSLLASSTTLEMARRLVQDELCGISWVLASDLLVDSIVTTLGQARDGCSWDLLMDKLAAALPPVEARERVLGRLCREKVVAAEAAELLDRGDFFGWHTGDGTSIVSADGIFHISEESSLMLAAAPVGPAAPDAIRALLAAELADYELDCPPEAFVRAAVKSLAAAGILRYAGVHGLVGQTGDPRPVLYVLLGPDWLQNRVKWERRVREAAEAAFASNPYRPLLTLVVDHPLEPEEAFALAWEARQLQLPFFDRSAIAVRADIRSPMGALVRVLRALVVAASQARVGVSASIQVSVDSVAAAQELAGTGVLAPMQPTWVLGSGVAFATAAQLVNRGGHWAEVSPETPTCLLEWASESTPDVVCWTAVLRGFSTRVECSMGDTAMLTETSLAAGCPVCGGQPTTTAALQSLRPNLARMFEAMPPTVWSSDLGPWAGRSCL